MYGGLDPHAVSKLMVDKVVPDSIVVMVIGRAADSAMRWSRFRALLSILKVVYALAHCKVPGATSNETEHWYGCNCGIMSSKSSIS